MAISRCVFAGIKTDEVPHMLHTIAQRLMGIDNDGLASSHRLQQIASVTPASQ